MDERFFNVSNDNTTSLSLNLPSLSPEESTVSANQIYVCNLYKFVVTGVIQLIISIIGFAGKSIERVRNTNEIVALSHVLRAQTLKFVYKMCSM